MLGSFAWSQNLDESGVVARMNYVRTARAGSLEATMREQDVHATSSLLQGRVVAHQPDMQQTNHVISSLHASPEGKFALSLANCR